MQRYDAAIIGGGPAGLTAATYLARLRRRVIVIDAGDSRARHIPLARNCPGFPDGVSGPDLLKRLTRQAARAGAVLSQGTVTGLNRDSGRYELEGFREPVSARAVLLATGTVDLTPDIPGLDPRPGRGPVRYCPICDAMEASDRRIAVIGRDRHGLGEAKFLKWFSPFVTLVTDRPGQLDERLKRHAGRFGIPVEAARRARTEQGFAMIETVDGQERIFDVVYPALGERVRSELAAALAVPRSASGHVKADLHQRAGLPGLYAAGDVTTALNQISVAFGQAAGAAVAMHRYLLD